MISKSLYFKIWFKYNLLYFTGDSKYARGTNACVSLVHLLMNMPFSFDLDSS